MCESESEDGSGSVDKRNEEEVWRGWKASWVGGWVGELAGVVVVAAGHAPRLLGQGWAGPATSSRVPATLPQVTARSRSLGVHGWNTGRGQG